MTYAFRVLAFFICEYGRRKSQHYFKQSGRSCFPYGFFLLLNLACIEIFWRFASRNEMGYITPTGEAPERVGIFGKRLGKIKNTEIIKQFVRI